MKFVDISRILSGKKKGKVRIRGWLHHKRSSGGIIFLLIRDGSGIIQTALSKEKVGEKVLERIDKLPIESTVEIAGEVKKDARAPGGHEIRVDEIKIDFEAKEDFPITKKYHGPDFLLDHRHLWLRSEKMQTILKVRAKVIKAAREWFDEHGFTEFHSPMFTVAACEGGATLFPVKYFGKRAYLTQSWQLYAEAAISSIGKIWTLAPSFRAEKSRTRRHITEYWHMEAEEPWCDLEGTMKTQERLVTHICHSLAKEMPKELRMFKRDPKELLRIKPPFKRITYDEAIKILKKDGVDVKWGEDLTWVHEKRLTMKFDEPFFVTHYPRGAKAFYHKPDPKRPEVTLSADLLAPEGYGEIIGAGQRIHDLDELMKRIKEEKLDPKDYEWYVDLRRFGTVPHSGFGMGIERLVMWLLKLDHIRDAIAFPRTPTRIYP